MRAVKMVVGNKPFGTAVTWAYPDGADDEFFEIPTYELTVSGTDGAGSAAERTFEVFRFGVQKEGSKGPRVVGLADEQTHTIKAWLPDYTVHSASSPEKGAWQVYDSFLIHDGPDDPKDRAGAYASIGCVEVCNGPEGFVAFNDYLIALSGPKAGLSRAQQLKAIGAARNLSITYRKATRPALVRL